MADEAIAGLEERVKELLKPLWIGRKGGHVQVDPRSAGLRVSIDGEYLFDIRGAEGVRFTDLTDGMLLTPQQLRALAKASKLVTREHLRLEAADAFSTWLKRVR